jgi:Holliday junction resolvase RusA-like endonuclease
MHTDRAREYWSFRERLQYTAKTFGWRPGMKLTSVAIVAWMPFPKSYGKKKRLDLVGSAHEIKPDATNLLKSIEDCLTEKDETVSVVSCAKIWAEDPKLKILIEVEE